MNQTSEYCFNYFPGFLDPHYQEGGGGGGGGGQ